MKESYALILIPEVVVPRLGYRQRFRYLFYLIVMNHCKR